MFKKRWHPGRNILAYGWNYFCSWNYDGFCYSLIQLVDEYKNFKSVLKIHLDAPLV